MGADHPYGRTGDPSPAYRRDGGATRRKGGPQASDPIGVIRLRRIFLQDAGSHDSPRGWLEVIAHEVSFLESRSSHRAADVAGERRGRAVTAARLGRRFVPDF